jgi:protein SCO1
MLSSRSVAHALGVPRPHSWGRQSRTADQAGHGPAPPLQVNRIHPHVARRHALRKAASIVCAGLALTLLGLGPGAAFAQQYGLPAMVRGVGIDQNLNAQIPIELTFKDETGQTVRLGQYFRQKPVVLALVYYECPMLCNMVLNGLSHSMEQISLDLSRDYEVVTVSFNPHETWQLAASKKANYVEKYQRKGAVEGWHFLTGQEDNIKKLADAAGFHYKYDPISKQFAHASGIMVLTPEGRIARYFYGIEYKPRDFRLGLVEASQHKIGSPVDVIMLFCYHYDPMTGKYGLVIMNVIRTLGSATVIALATLLIVLFRRERHGPASAGGRVA